MLTLRPWRSAISAEPCPHARRRSRPSVRCCGPAASACVKYPWPRIAQRNGTGGRISGGEPGQHQHRVAVAARTAGERRCGGEEAGDLQRREQLETVAGRSTAPRPAPPGPASGVLVHDGSPTWRSCLPRLPPSNRRRSPSGALSRPSRTSCSTCNVPSASQPSKRAARLGEAILEVVQQEALHPCPSCREQLVVVQADLGSLGAVTGRDRPAEGEPSVFGDVEQGGVEQRPADVVEHDVVTGRRLLAKAAAHVVVVVVDALVEPGDVAYPGALGFAAGRADHPGRAEVAGHLTGDRPRGTGGGGDQDGVAVDGLADVRHAEVRRHSGHAGDAEHQLRVVDLGWESRPARSVGWCRRSRSTNACVCQCSVPWTNWPGRKSGCPEAIT